MTDNNKNTDSAQPAPTPPGFRKATTHHLTLVNAVKTSKVKHLVESWSALTARLTCKPVITENREALDWPLFVPFQMKRGADGAAVQYNGAYSRCIANVLAADLLCLDIDNDPKKGLPYLSIDEAKRVFAPYSYVLYTSYNHQNKSKHGGVDKFRIVLPLLEPVTYEDLTDRKAALKELFPFIDPASFAISQPFYVPMAHPDRAKLHTSHEGAGELFDLFSVKAKQTIQQTSSSATYVPTGELHDDLPMIRLKDGRHLRADDLYNQLQEGYANRKGCYRLVGHDSKPGCYIYRLGGVLLHFDDGKKTVIKVLKTLRVRGPNDDPNDVGDDAPVQLWKRSTPVAPSATAVATPKSKNRGKLLELAKTHAPLTITKLNSRYLPRNLWKQIPNEGITVIRSPKGTGKTEALKRLISASEERHESVMLLGHRVYLLKDLANRTNLDYYLELADGETTNSMALCMNSLTRIDRATDEPYHTIIIDESEQVLQALVSRTMTQDVNVVFTNLIWLFKHAKRIICLDADLSADLTIELINELRGIKDDDEVVGIINEYKIGVGQTTYMYESRFHLLAEALAAIQDGEKVFIACNNRKFATIVDAVAKQLGKTSLLITSETNDNEDTQDFIENPTDECKRYDLVIASPTLSTGVSIEGDHFTRVYGFFGHNPGTYQDADQAVSRVRNAKEVRIWIQGSSGVVRLPSEENVYDEAIEREHGTLKTLPEERQNLTQGQLLWGRVYARIVYMAKVWSINKDEQFATLREELGFTLVPVVEDEVSADAAKAVYYSIKDAGIDRAPLIHDAEVIDLELATELGRKRQRTKEEQLSLDRYNLEQYLSGDWTVETIRKAIKQELLRNLSRIRTLHTISPTERQQYDADDRAKNEKTFTASRHRTMQHELIKYLCMAGKVDLDELLTQAQGEDEVEVPKAALIAIASAYECKKRDFNFYFAARIKNPTDEKNVKKVWDATFAESLSLHLVKKNRGPKANREWKYFLDLSKKDLVHSVRKEFQL